MSTTDAPFDLIASKARCDAASEGPWEDHGTIDQTVAPWAEIVGLKELGGPWQLDHELFIAERDRVFITHARTDLPAAIARIERAEASNAALTAELRELRQTAARMFAAIDQGRVGRVPIRMAQLRKLVATA